MIAKEAVVAEHLSFLNVIVLSIGSTSAVDDPRFRICTKRDNDKVESLLRENSTIISVKSYRPYPSIACLILQFSAIRTLPYLDAEEVAVQKDVNALLAKQQADGGWSQTDDMTSDAFATMSTAALIDRCQVFHRSPPHNLQTCRYEIRHVHRVDQILR